MQSGLSSMFSSLPPPHLSFSFLSPHLFCSLSSSFHSLSSPLTVGFAVASAGGYGYLYNDLLSSLQHTQGLLLPILEEQRGDIQRLEKRVEELEKKEKMNAK